MSIAHSAWPHGASRKIRPQGATEASLPTWHRQPRDPTRPKGFMMTRMMDFSLPESSVDQWPKSPCYIRDSETMAQLWSWGKPEENWVYSQPK